MSVMRTVGSVCVLVCGVPCSAPYKSAPSTRLILIRESWCLPGLAVASCIITVKFPEHNHYFAEEFLVCLKCTRIYEYYSHDGGVYPSAFFVLEVLI